MKLDEIQTSVEARALACGVCAAGLRAAAEMGWDDQKARAEGKRRIRGRRCLRLRRQRTDSRILADRRAGRLQSTGLQPAAGPTARPRSQTGDACYLSRSPACCVWTGVRRLVYQYLGVACRGVRRLAGPPVAVPIDGAYRSALARSILAVLVRWRGRLTRKIVDPSGPSRRGDSGIGMPCDWGA